MVENFKSWKTDKIFCADVHAHIHTTEYIKKKQLIDLIFSPPQLEDLVKSLKWRVYVQVNLRPKSLNFTRFYIIYALTDSQMKYIKGDSSFPVLPNKADSYWMWRDFKCRRDQEKLRTNSWSENVFALCEKCWMISKPIIVLFICQWRSHSSERIMTGQGNVIPFILSRWSWLDATLSKKRVTFFEIQIPHPKWNQNDLPKSHCIVWRSAKW